MDLRDRQRVVGIISGVGFVMVALAVTVAGRNQSSIGLVVLGLAAGVVAVVGIVGWVVRWAFVLRRPNVLAGAFVPVMGVWLASQSASTTAKVLWSGFVVLGLALLAVSLRPVDDGATPRAHAS